ncbi:MAG: DUF3501 family protein [Candidatus Eisenbacteria bacterium]|nr:DUF3501 family protein [Candidatus Eisenbacteria bacterium]
MEPIRRSEIKDLAGYEKVRAEIRRRAIEQRAARRVGLGKRLSAVFESREALAYQIQEALRARRTVDEGEIEREIDAVNELLPRAGTLAATLFVEFADGEPFSEPPVELGDLRERGGVSIEVGGATRVAARAGGDPAAGAPSFGPVRLSFAFTAEAAASFRDASLPAALVVELRGYGATADLSPAVRTALAGDLGEV